MANILNQTVFQVGEEIPTRMIVQYTNGEGEQLQTINNYDKLTDDEKLIFDNFKELSESKMI
tara:strand:- start:1032 stop:1217 length:186 start_codon:yes stop_codon:yes gene_type:complete